MKRWLRITVTLAAAAVLLPGLAVGILYFGINPDGYRAQLVAATRSATGAELEIAQPLAWQLWPLGLKLERLSLRAPDGGEVLLSAREAAVSLRVLQLLRGTPRVATLALSGAQIFYRRHDEGHSNWDAVLERLRKNADAGVETVVLQDSELVLHDNATAAPAGMTGSSITISNLTLGPTDSDRSRPLQVAFTFSRQNSAGKNILAQNSLQTHVTPADNANLRLANTTLHSELSSTLFPGLFKVDLTGDFLASNDRLASDAVTLAGDYKTMSMAEAAPFKLKTPLVLEPSRHTLALTAFEFTVGATTRPAATVSGQLQASWPEAGIVVTLERAQLQLPQQPAVALRLGARIEGAEIRVDEFHGSVGSGSFDLPLCIDTRGTPALSAQLDAKELDAAILGRLLTETPVTGRLTAHGRLQAQGFSLQEWQQSATGSVSLQLKDGRFGKANLMQSLMEKIAGYRSLLPELAAETGQAHMDMTPDIANLEADNHFASGVVSTALHVELGQAQIRSNGNFDTRRRTIAYDVKLQLDKTLFEAQKADLSLPMRCEGNLTEEQLEFVEALRADCKIEEQAMHALMSDALSRRFHGG